jgi:hypothetical protein
MRTTPSAEPLAFSDTEIASTPSSFATLDLPPSYTRNAVQQDLEASPPAYSSQTFLTSPHRVPLWPSLSLSPFRNTRSTGSADSSLTNPYDRDLLPTPPPSFLVLGVEPAAMEDWREQHDELGPPPLDPLLWHTLHLTWDRTAHEGAEPVWCHQWTRALNELASHEEWLRIRHLHHRDYAVSVDDTGAFSSEKVEEARLRHRKRCGRGYRKSTSFHLRLSLTSLTSTTAVLVVLLNYYVRFEMANGVLYDDIWERLAPFDDGEMPTFEERKRNRKRGAFVFSFQVLLPSSSVPAYWYYALLHTSNGSTDTPLLFLPFPSQSSEEPPSSRCRRSASESSSTSTSTLQQSAQHRSRRRSVIAAHCAVCPFSVPFFPSVLRLLSTSPPWPVPWPLPVPVHSTSPYVVVVAIHHAPLEAYAVSDTFLRFYSFPGFLPLSTQPLHTPEQPKARTR